MTRPADPLAVVHVCCTDSFAGVERHVTELALAQAERGDRVLVIGGHLPRMRTALKDRVDVLPGHRIATALRSLRSMDFRPHVLNAHMTAAEIACLLGRPAGVPVIATRHFAAARGAATPLRPILRALGQRLAGQIAVSRYVADHVDGPSTVVLTGVPAHIGRAAARDREPWVLVAQRLEAEKDTEMALRAFAGSGLPETGWLLKICGDGSLRPELERRAVELRIDDSTEFLGHRSDVHELMRRAGILFASGPREAFGLSIVEAMACGLPVVAAGSGAHLETLGSVPDAALFAPDDPDGAARLLAELARDVSLRDAYGRRLQDAQRDLFTVDVQARNTDAAYRSFL